MRTRSVWWVLAATVVGIQAACGGGDGGTEPTPTPKPVASVAVSPASRRAGG